MSVIQLFCILILSTLGGGFLSLPREVAEIAKQDSWFSTLIGGGLLLFSTLLALRTAQMFPNHSLDTYSEIVLGNFFGKIHTLVLVLLFVLIIGLEVRTLVAIVKLFLLDQTPAELISFLALFVVYRLVLFGLEPAMNYYTSIIAPVILVTMILVFPILNAINFSELKPILQGWKPILKAVPKTLYAYTGPQLLIGFMYHALYRKEKASTWTLLIIGALTVYYTSIQVVTMTIFGAEELHYLQYPTLMIFRAVEVEAGFIERLDAVALLTYLPINIAAISIWHATASSVIAKQIKLEGPREISLLLVGLTYICANFPTDAALVRKIAEWIGHIVVVYSVIIIPLIWAIGKYRAARTTTYEQTR